MKNPLTFICRQKIMFILHVFLEILQRYCKLLFLGTLGIPGYTNPKLILSTCRKLLCPFADKKSTSPFMLFWRYWKDIQTYFGYFGHAWLHTPKMIVPTCRRLWCVSACQKMNFIIHIFFEILHFKESCNLISWQHYGP